MKIDHALSSFRLDASGVPDPHCSSDVVPLQGSARPWLRRAAFWAPILAATVACVWLAAVATAGAGGALRLPLLGLLGLSVFYMALTGMPALVGVMLHLSGRRLLAAARPSGVSRTAVLMPVHKEEPRAVFTAIEVMARAVAEAGLPNVDLYVLSDTQDEAMAAAEQAAFDAVAARADWGAARGLVMPGLHYRRRAGNAGRKAGNLAEFCERWGDAYDYMLVLDADSLMGASAIGRLIGLMDANPRAGIIQTVPYAVGRETLFARLQQFSARLYTPLLVEGLTYWQEGDGNYWGHNAILRIAPFRAHCALPVLPGREPFGGEILCHDVVEAGLMRGAGWEVWVLPEVLESYEAVPANLVDFAARERRWCQGNLQHGRVLGMPGFRAVGRFHMAYGITHYLAAPVALLFLLLGTVDGVMGGGVMRALLAGGAASHWLVGLTAVLLYGGKVASLAVTMWSRAEAARFGGRWALLGSAVLEQVLACVVSALLIVSYSRYVAELVRGRTVRWEVQARDDRGVSWGEGWLRMRVPVLLGVMWLVALPALPGSVMGWTLPLLLGLLAAWPLAVLGSRTTLGGLARRFRLLLTPEEASPPGIVRAYQRAMMTEERPVAVSGAGGLKLHLVPQVEAE